MAHIPEHGWLTEVESHWPVIASVSAVTLGSIRLWWYKRKQREKRISNIEIIAERIGMDMDYLKKELMDNTSQHTDITKRIDDVFKTISKIHSESSSE